MGRKCTRILILFVLLGNFCRIQGQDQKGREKEILEWKPPTDYKTRFPYGMTGFDIEGSPFWYIPYGAWDVRSAAEGTEEDSSNFDKHVEQMWERFAVSAKLFSNETITREGFSAIGDLDGFNTRQLAHFPTVQKFANVARYFVSVVQRYGNFNKGLIVNSNFLFQTMWNFVSPSLGALKSRVDVYGTNPEKWKPLLFKHVPRESLPEKLGGTRKNGDYII